MRGLLMAIVLLTGPLRAGAQIGAGECRRAGAGGVVRRDVAALVATAPAC
jgi:hypothetical protein